MNFNDIILLDGSKHNSISEAVEYLVKKHLEEKEKTALIPYNFYCEKCEKAFHIMAKPDAGVYEVINACESKHNLISLDCDHNVRLIRTIDNDTFKGIDDKTNKSREID